MERYRTNHDFDKRFPLWHCILYYLGWYERTGDKWADLKNCLTMDGYCGESMSNADAFRLILHIADDFNLHCANNGWKLISVAAILQDDEYWVNKYRERGLENPDWLVSIDKLFSKFAFDYTRSEVKLPRPDFKKGDPLHYSNWGTGRTYKQANKHTEDYNWEGVAPDYDWRKYYQPSKRR